MTNRWFTGGEGEYFEFMARQCQSCKQQKKGGGKMALGQHWCKLLWGGIEGNAVNLYARAAWVRDGTTGKMLCRQRQPKPPRRLRRRKPDPQAQTTLDFEANRGDS